MCVAAASSRFRAVRLVGRQSSATSLIALSFFLIADPWPESLDSPQKPTPNPPGWALRATPRVRQDHCWTHLHEHLSNTSWQPTATFWTVFTPPTNYVLLGCRHGHAHGTAQHGHELVLVSRHEHQPPRKYGHELEHGPLQYAHEPCKHHLQRQPRLLGHAQCPAELKPHERNNEQISLSILFQPVPATWSTVYGSVALTNAQHGFADARLPQFEQHCCYPNCRPVHIAHAAHVCLAITVHVRPILATTTAPPFSQSDSRSTSPTATVRRDQPRISCRWPGKHEHGRIEPQP